MSTNEIKNQLKIFHNPFSTATSQPKIPDGKVNDSLGFATQQVVEISNNSGNDTIHCIMYAGRSSGAVFTGTSQAALGSRPYYIPGFTASSGADWDAAVTATTGAFDVVGRDNYALWRVVSAGMQLKLLNSAETDDGWWEAIRLTPEFEADNYVLTTVNDTTNIADFGCVSPAGLVQKNGLQNLSMVNESTYSTGLLRDLHRIQFELHGKMDYHDFHQCADAIRVPANGIAAIDKTLNYQTSFVDGNPDLKDLVDEYIDSGYDMMYVRLHCRPQATGASRFHANIVSNQEIKFDQATKESRFQTKSHSIGANATSVHHQARRGGQTAAKMVVG